MLDNAKGKKKRGVLESYLIDPNDWIITERFETGVPRFSIAVKFKLEDLKLVWKHLKMKN